MKKGVKMKFKSTAYILTAGFLWGSMGIFVHKLTDGFGFGSLSAAALRIISGAVLLFIFLAVYDVSLLKIRLCDVPLLAANGFFSIFLMTVFYFASISGGTSMSISAVLLYTAPFIVMLISCVFMGEAVTLQKVIALFTAFFGCCLVSLSEPGFSTPSGIVCGVISGFAYALYSVFGKLALKKHHPYTVTFYSFLFAGICSLVPLFTTGAARTVYETDRPASLALWIIAAGLITAVLPFLLYTKGLMNVSPSKASIMAYAEPISACIFGLFLNEKMTAKMIFGIVLVLAAIVFLNVDIKKLISKEKNK